MIGDPEKLEKISIKKNKGDIIMSALQLPAKREFS
jgi:hypothetical protein